MFNDLISKLLTEAISAWWAELWLWLESLFAGLFVGWF
jgi:hypothetical protein